MNSEKSVFLDGLVLDNCQEHLQVSLADGLRATDLFGDLPVALYRVENFLYKVC